METDLLVLLVRINNNNSPKSDYSPPTTTVPHITTSRPPGPYFYPPNFSQKNIFSFVAFKKHVLKVRVHWKFLVCNFFVSKEEKIDDEDENNADVTFNFLNKRKKKSIIYIGWV